MSKFSQYLDSLQDLSDTDIDALVKMVRLLRRHVTIFERDQLNINCLDVQLEDLVPEQE